MLLLRPVRPHTVAACVYGTRFFGGSRAVALRNPQLHNHAAAALVMLEDEKLLIRTRRHQPLVSCGTKLMLSGRRSFSIRVTSEVNDSGSIDSPLMQSMEKKIKEHLNAELVIVKDAYGDGRHVSIHVVSSAFEGQSAVNRQRMVYKAIWEELQNTVHAVDQMTTKTPNEAAPPGN